MEVIVKNLAEIELYFNQLPEETFEDAKGVFQRAVIRAHRKTQQILKWRLNRRTGMLARSMQMSVTGKKLNTLKASNYSLSAVGAAQVPYAPIQEFGGTITAKRAYRKVPGGPYLNIPVGNNLTPAGVMRYSAKEVFSRKGAHIRKFKSGKYGVFLKNDLMFVLVKRVHIPARLGMIKANEDQVPTILSELQNLIGE